VTRWLALTNQHRGDVGSRGKRIRGPSVSVIAHLCHPHTLVLPVMLKRSTNTHLKEPAAAHCVYTAVLLLVACHERVGRLLTLLAGKPTRQRFYSTRSTLGIRRLHNCMQSRPSSISRISFLTIEGDFQGVHHQATLIQRPSRLHNIVSGPLSTCGQSEGSQFSRTSPSSTYFTPTHNFREHPHPAPTSRRRIILHSHATTTIPTVLSKEN